MADYAERCRAYYETFEKHLGAYLSGLKLTPEILDESFRYSLLVGGKRIRPVIMLATADFLGVSMKDALDFALPLELIHTYSLIHDDLPEMDDADFRRGKPSSHKKFGAGYAVLAGDALLNTAYSLLFRKCPFGEKYIKAASLICDKAGVGGMIAGQYADLRYDGSGCEDPSVLEYIYDKKTAGLISAAFLVPSVLADGEYEKELSSLGRKAGYLFQLVDDILDAEGSSSELGKDAGKDDGKCTAVSLYGPEGSRKKADEIATECLDIISGMDGDTSFFESLVEDLRTRVK
ncbi:MAG: polyprenyl synthetase family protein [Clostridia bacterium]|nr:polyprenyl synthetase family protein [Clostridia bacterium]